LADSGAEPVYSKSYPGLKRERKIVMKPTGLNREERRKQRNEFGEEVEDLVGASIQAQKKEMEGNRRWKRAKQKLTP